MIRVLQPSNDDLTETACLKFNAQLRARGSRDLIALAVVFVLSVIVSPAVAQTPEQLHAPNVCDQGPSGPPPCKDSDGDGLCDSWEIAQRMPGGAPLPEADPYKPDIYVQYDWMDYGPMETACNNNSDCTLYSGLHRATCSGPALTQGYLGSCVLACATDSDCTSLGPSHATDRCGAAHGIQQCLHTHDPAVLVPNGNGGSKALDAVVAAFAAHKINLHIMRGQAQPHSHVLSFRTLAGLVPITDSCEGGSVASGTAGPGLYAESLYDLKAKSFDPRLNASHHYMVFAHYSSCDTPSHCQSCPTAQNPDGTIKPSSVQNSQNSGIAEFYGNDFILSMGASIDETGNLPGIFPIGSTFMHELGHNLGLHHGGGFLSDGTWEADPALKPNYLSVMNYNYQALGIPIGANIGDNTPVSCILDSDCPTGAYCLPHLPNHLSSCRVLDYSTQVLPTGTATPGTLDESNLDEAAGLGSGNSLIFTFTDGSCNPRFAATNGPVDWDGDGVAGDNPAAAVDLMPALHQGKPCGFDTTQKYDGRMDWPPGAPQPKFTYRFQCTSEGND
jgi:hypothetical protein